MENLIDMLRYMVEQKGSDLYLSTGATPSIKLHGKLTKVPGTNPLTPGDTTKLISPYLSKEHITSFHKNLELNFAISESGLGRFRVNLFNQRHEMGIVIRAVSTHIPTIEELDLPFALKEIAMFTKGLVLFVGGTGAGKSTSLAALIDYRNKNCAEHIISIEDPIEFIHRNQQSIVNQREVGIDTHDYGNALKNALRQAPDVVLIGEIRASETMEHAIAFSETGHLCLSTLHATNANQGLDRVINFFPENKKAQILLDLSFNLKAIVSQRLIPTQAGNRVAVFEILLASPLISDLIRRGEIAKIKEVMESSEDQGMQTFDKALYDQVIAGNIDADTALKNADSYNNLRLRLSQTKGFEANKLGMKLELKEEEQKDDQLSGLQESARRKKRDND